MHHEVDSCLRFIEAEKTDSFCSTMPHKNDSRNFLAESRLSNALNRVPGVELVRDLSPRLIRRLGSRLLKKTIVQDPVWNRDALNFVRKTIVLDSTSFLDYSGHPNDFWDFSDVKMD